MALGLEEVLNTEIVLISAALYSYFCGEFCHIPRTFKPVAGRGVGRERSSGVGSRLVWARGLCGGAILPCSTEPGAHWGWKRPLRASSPAVSWALPGQPPNPVLKCHICTSSNPSRWLHHLPGQPVPMSDNLFHEERFANIQPKPPPVQLEADPSCPITCYLGGKTNPHLSPLG